MKRHIRIFFQNLVRHSRESFKNIGRNFGLSISSIAAITITLVVTSLFLLAIINVNNFSELVKQEVTIYVELNEDVTDEAAETILADVKKMENIRTVKYSSKDDELDLLIEAYGENSNVFEMYRGEDNPLHNVMIVSVTDVEQISETAEAIGEKEGIFGVRYGEGLIEYLLEFFNIVQQVSLIIIIALFLVTSFLIANTIKITIFSRRKEVEIMRLVGASKMFIKTPFVFEGFLIGLMGAIIPVSLTVYGYMKAYELFGSQTSVQSPFIQLVQPDVIVWPISLVLAVLGVLIGMWGSSRAVRKFLKV